MGWQRFVLVGLRSAFQLDKESNDVLRRDGV
jgi:hypothetical protein